MQYVPATKDDIHVGSVLYVGNMAGGISKTPIALKLERVDDGNKLTWAHGLWGKYGEYKMDDDGTIKISPIGRGEQQLHYKVFVDGKKAQDTADADNRFKSTAGRRRKTRRRRHQRKTRRSRK